MHFSRESRTVNLFPAAYEASITTLTLHYPVVYRVAQLQFQVLLDAEKRSSRNHCPSIPTAMLSFTLVVGNVVMKCLKCCGIFPRSVKQRTKLNFMSLI